MVDSVRHPRAPSPVTQSAVDSINHKLAWQRYVSLVSASPMAIAANGGLASGDRTRAGQIAADFMLRDPTVSALVEHAIATMIGTGLRISAKPDHIALECTEAEALALSKEIERQWNNAAATTAFDYHRRMTLTDMLVACLRSWLAWGEVFISVESRYDKDCRFVTRFQILDPRQIDHTQNSVTPEADGSRTVQGVRFAANGTVAGYYVHDYKPGDWQNHASRYVEARTTWGRPKIAHIFEPSVSPAQVRGLSPLTASIDAAQERAFLNEQILANLALQSMVAISIESDLPPAQALGVIEVDNHGSGGQGIENLIAARAAWHEAQGKIQITPGVVNTLAPGEKLKMNSVENSASELAAVDKSLRREAATAFGASYDLTFSDLSETSFSAARLGLELPHRTMTRRRDAILGKVVRLIYHCWLEETLARGHVERPAESPTFWEETAGWSRCAVLGPSKPSPDPVKTVEASAMAIANNLSTLEAELGANGLDLSEVLAQRAQENEQLRAAGLPIPGAQPIRAAKPAPQNPNIEEA